MNPLKEFNSDFFRLSPNPTETKIRGFKNKEKGWHLGEGEPPTTFTIDIAVWFLGELLAREFSETDAFPGVWGEIEVCGYHEASDLGFIIERDGSVSALFERGEEEIESKEKTTVQEALRLLKSWSKIIFGLSDGSTASIGSPKKEDSDDLPSIIPATNVVFPYFLLNVQFSNQAAFAITSKSSTEESQISPIFSGRFLKTAGLGILPPNLNSMRSFETPVTTIYSELAIKRRETYLRNQNSLIS